jgi:hypothetical protein
MTASALTCMLAILQLAALQRPQLTSNPASTVCHGLQLPSHSPTTSPSICQLQRVLARLDQISVQSSYGILRPLYPFSTWPRVLASCTTKGSLSQPQASSLTWVPPCRDMQH